MRLLAVGLFYSLKFPTGAGISFSSLMNELNKDINFKVKQINIAHFSQSWPASLHPVFLRFLDISHIIFYFLKYINFYDALYLYLSPNFLGFFLKDAPLILISKLLGKKIFMTVRSGAYQSFIASLPSAVSSLIAYVLRQSNKIVVISPSLSSQFDFLNSPEKMTVIPNSCNSFFYDNVSPRGNSSRAGTLDSYTKSLEKTRRITILYISNFITSKGYLDLIESVITLNQKHNDMFRLRMFGKFVDYEPSDRHVHLKAMPREKINTIEDFSSFLSSTNLSGSIAVNSPISGSKKDYEFCSADIFALPSYYRVEGCPISIIEAMAYSLPIVATSWRAIPDLVSNAWNGYTVPLKSPPDITDAIEKIVFNDDYSFLSSNSRQRFQRNHAFAGYLSSYKALFLGNYK